MDVSILNFEKLRNFISEITFTEVEKIKENTLLFEEGIFDSLGFLSLISFLNDEFSVEVDNNELNEENFESINAIVDFIARKKQIQGN